MPTLLMLKGLPASGKSTYARTLVDKGWVRVNKDDLRAMLHSGRHSKGNEKQVLAIRDKVVIDSLIRGRNVVVDDTNFNSIHEETLRTIATEANATFEIDDHFVSVPIEECIKRDLVRPNSVGERVIRQMYNQYLKPYVEQYEQDFSKPAAILCDIDGTLAHMGSRSPYDWDKVGDDTPDYAIRDILRRYWEGRDPQDAEVATTIILLSGRDEVCRAETEKWLELHNVKYDYLYMRPQGDSRKDAIVKRELFDAHIAGRYNVLFVMDDRNQMVEMWRGIGIKCLQVADGDF